MIHFLDVYPSLEQLIKEWNNDFVEKELSDLKGFFNDIDGKSLDEQQRRAIVIDEDNNLIVAGAGSGKTLTVSGKVKYLVEKKGVNPEEDPRIFYKKGCRRNGGKSKKALKNRCRS